MLDLSCTYLAHRELKSNIIIIIIMILIIYINIIIVSCSGSATEAGV